MTKKRALRVGQIWLPLILMLLISSCAPIGYDFVGIWNRQPDTLTYINPDQRIKLTFPNDKWRVYTEPTNERLRYLWKRPAPKDSSYVVLYAFGPKPAPKDRSVLSRFGPEVLMGLQINPLQGHRPPIAAKDISLDEYLALMKREMESKSAAQEIDYKVIQRKGRRMGVLTSKGKDTKYLGIIFKEKDRFSVLAFFCDEELFESKKNQFWAIVDSYEYLE